MTNELAIVGSSLRVRPAERLRWTIFAVVVLLADLLLAFERPLYERLVLGIVAVLAFAGLAARPEHGADAIGLRLVPAQGFRWWIGATLAIGVVLLTLLFAVPPVLAHFGNPVRSPAWTHDRSTIVSHVISQAWLYPPYEEVIYRLVLCVVLAAWCRPGLTIVLGWLTFSGLHWVYGNPAPDNQLAGIVLVWAFLKSRSLLVPIVMHSLGNLCGIVAAVVSG